jgi:hypothetical protein
MHKLNVATITNTFLAVPAMHACRSTGYLQHHPPVSTYKAGAMVISTQKFELLVEFLKTTMLPVVEYELQKLEAEKDDANLFWANAKAALTARLQEKALPAWLKES